jgi:hypothetical protein
VIQLIESLKQLALEQFPEDENNSNSPEVSDIITNEMESVDLETFLMWAVDRSSLKHLLDMLHQVKKNLNETRLYYFSHVLILLL